MNTEEIKLFEKVIALLEGLHEEIILLTKKIPNSALNEFKVKFVNLTLVDANRLLEDEYRPFKEFTQFDTTSLPTNSDVTMILSQYLNCMENLRADNIVEREESTEWGSQIVWFWKGSKIKTSRPKKLSK